MSPTRTGDEMVEVRLRYRPVGDVLTISVRSGLPEGPRFQTEPDHHTIIEWLRMPDGSSLMAAMQVIGARDRSPDDGPDPLLQLSPQLRHDALDLIDPGRRHHGHPSAHRPVAPTATTDLVPLLHSSEILLDQPPPPDRGR